MLIMTALIVKNKAVDGIKLMHSLHLTLNIFNFKKAQFN